MRRLTALICVLLLDLSCTITVVPSCIDRVTGLPRHRDEDRLRDEMQRLELQIRDEPDGERREQLRERFRQVFQRLEEIAAEQRRRAEPHGER
jgi:hypothetical protein